MYAFLALLVAGPWQYEITCNSSPCQVADQIYNAMASCAASPPVPDSVTNSRGGCEIVLPAGEIHIDREIRVCRAHKIKGRGGRFWGARTQIKTDGNYNAFRMAYFDECQTRGEGGGAGGAEIEDLAIIGKIDTDTVRTSAILIEASRVRVARVWTRGFVHGLRIDADVNRPERTNANVFRIEDSSFDSAQHAAVWIDGGDTNAGSLAGIDATRSCRKWKSWNSISTRCANLYDSSFLGNAVVSAHTSLCRDNDGTTCPGYIFEGQSQRSVCVGCYAEGDQDASDLAPNSMSVGGLGGWTGPGGWYFGHRARRLVVINDEDPNNIVQLEMGSGIAAGTAWQVRAPSISQGWPLALHADPNGWWTLRLANSNTWTPFRIRGNRDNPTYNLGDFQLAPVTGYFYLGSQLID